MAFNSTVTPSVDVSYLELESALDGADVMIAA